MALREYLCRECGHQFEEIVHAGEPEPGCPHCESGGKVERLFSAHGGYSIRGNNSASQRPRQAGSFRGRK